MLVVQYIILSHYFTEGPAKGSCCITDLSIYDDAGKITVTIEGKGSYTYPSNYGALDCKAHDQNKEPDCGLVAAADGQKSDHCESEWCFIDRSKPNCENVKVETSGYVTGQYYSYTYCGNPDPFSE